MAQRGRQGQVRIPPVLRFAIDPDDAHRTESYDDMKPVGEDVRWDVFGSFHDYLLQSFPLVHVFLSS